MNKEFIKVLATILGTVRINDKGQVVKELEFGRSYPKSVVVDWQEATEVIRLVPLSEFVELANTIHDTDDDRFSNDVLFYTRFITQQLTKGQLKELFNTDILKANDFCFHEIDDVKTIEHFINNGVELYLKQ